jgi:hypothetical protein
MTELAVANTSAVARCIVSGTLLCYRLMLQHVHAEVYIVHFWFSGSERATARNLAERTVRLHCVVVGSCG